MKVTIGWHMSSLSLVQFCQTRTVSQPYIFPPNSTLAILLLIPLSVVLDNLAVIVLCGVARIYLFIEFLILCTTCNAQ